MRKIERQMLQAVNTPGMNWKNSNTRTRWSDDQKFVEVLLHGHIIASINWATSTMVICDCNHQTNTTKSRLNALLGELARFQSARITQKNFQWILDRGVKTCEMKSGFDYCVAI